MLELNYPSSPAPILKGSDRAKSAEMIPIIDEGGMVLCQASRSFVHSGSKPLHPVVHLHIINRKGELYLQQRGRSKDLLPLKWDTAVGGHISYGEYVLEALFREAGEELSLFDFNPHSITSYIFESQVERELVNVFATVGDFALKPNLDELEGGRFWREEEIEKTLGKGIFTPNFEGEYVKIKDKLLSLL